MGAEFYWVDCNNPKARLPFCVAHKAWPCRRCGTSHYKGCECSFCVEPSPIPEPHQYERKVLWWKCGAPDCTSDHVDEKRARSCPNRKRAINAARLAQ